MNEFFESFMFNSCIHGIYLFDNQIFIMKTIALALIVAMSPDGNREYSG